MNNETAGPFGRSEMETVREHYRYIQQREDAQRRLRIEALRMAVSARDGHDNAADIAEAAKVYHQFLTGGDS